MKKLLLTLSLWAACAAQAADTKIIFIAGRPSHGPLSHEHRAGCLLLQKCLAGVPGVVTEVHTNGWVSDEKVFEGAAAVVVYSDGGGGHPFLQGDRLQKIGALMQKGVGLGAIHYAVEPTTAKGNAEFRDWIGGCFETFWSVNPHWDGDFKEFPKHPVTSGVKPFKTNDEWYYHMRFRDGMKDVTPILTALPPERTTGWNKDKPADAKPSTHGGNKDVFAAVVERKEPQHVMWVATRPDGGRGFGFTGGHNHLGWGNADQRKLVLNTILWIAKRDVPTGGVESAVTQDDLMANLDPKGAPKPKPQPAKTEEKK
jgi:type 1 glutamine amidotransferase